MQQHLFFREAARPDNGASSPSPADFLPLPDAALLRRVIAAPQPLDLFYGVGDVGAQVVRNFVTQLDCNLHRPYVAATATWPGTTRPRQVRAIRDPLLQLAGRVGFCWFVARLGDVDGDRLVALAEAWQAQGVAAGQVFLPPDPGTPAQWDRMVGQASRARECGTTFETVIVAYDDVPRAHWLMLKAVIARRPVSASPSFTAHP